MTYINIDELKLNLGGITGTSDDAILQMAVDRAQKWIESKTHRVFEASANTTRYFTASSEDHGGSISDSDPLDLILDYDLATISGMVITNGDGVVVTSGQYTVKPKNSPPFHTIRLLPNSNIAWTYSTDPDDAISIAAKWAWSVLPPDDVKYAVTRLAGYLYKQRDSWQELDRVVITNTGATMLPPGFPKDVADVASLYWRRGLG